MQWARLTATLVAAFTICVLLESQSQVAALPTLRTYRGVSPYKAIAEGGLNPGPRNDYPVIMDPSGRRRHPKENWDPKRESAQWIFAG